MPFQPINFANIPTFQPRDENFVELLGQAYKTGMMPQAFQKEQRSAALADQLRQEQIRKLQNPAPSEFDKKMQLFQQLMKGQMPGGVGEEVARNKELANQFLRHKLGIGELPSEREAREISAEQRKFEQQKQLKEFESGLREKEQAGKVKDEETGATKTANQKRVKAVHSLMPMLANLINFENPQNWSLSPFSSTQSQVRRYKDLTTLPIESIMSGFGWQSVKENIQKAQDLVQIGAGENVQDYRKRIVQLSEDILREVEGLPGADAIIENMPKVKMVYKNQLLEVPLSEVSTLLKEYKGAKFYEKK